MELLILRHAIAFPRDPARWPDDGQRPLTAAGVRRARRAAAGLKRLATRPTLVLTSPLVRARDTATLFAQAARWPKAVECEALAPGARPQEVLAALRRQGGGADCVAVVGHQPHLGELLALCLPAARAEGFELRKSGIARVRFDGAPRPGEGVLEWLLSPRVLRRVT